jgi:hypothetical protein
MHFAHCTGHIQQPLVASRLPPSGDRPIESLHPAQEFLLGMQQTAAGTCSATGMGPGDTALSRVGRTMPDLINFNDEVELGNLQSGALSQSSGLPSLTLTDDDPQRVVGPQTMLAQQPPIAAALLGMEASGRAQAAGMHPRPSTATMEVAGARMGRNGALSPLENLATTSSAGPGDVLQVGASRTASIVALSAAQSQIPRAQQVTKAHNSVLQERPHHPVAIMDVKPAGDWEVDPREITLGPRIGIGSYGEVYKGTWRGTEVAVKRFLEQNLSPQLVQEFRGEVDLMARLRHPNVVLFMGAVTQPNQLAIITQFVPRGSLFRLLHRARVQIDSRRRLQMATDIARGKFLATRVCYQHLRCLGGMDGIWAHVQPWC